MTSLTLQTAITKNANITFGDHVHTDTVEYFRGMRQSTIKVAGNLLPEEMAEVEALFPVPVVWTAPPHASIAPHGKLGVIRSTLRCVLDDMLLLTRNLKTLYIGAAYREIAANVRTSNAFFSLHDSEAKDEMRTFVPMLDKVNNLMSQAKAQAEDLRHVEVDISVGKQQMLDLYKEVTGMQDNRIGFVLERDASFKCSRLIYEDSYYNKDWEGIYEDFRSTGASIAYTIGLMPDQLLETHVPDNNMLRIQRKEGKMRMTDRRGHVNGYIHDEKKWGTLLSAPGYAGKDFNLVTEIVTRVGPFMITTISRTQNGGTIVRDITVFKEPYVKVVDLSTVFSLPENMAEACLRKKTDMDRFFLVKRDEWESCYNYVASLDPKAVTQTAVVASIRKRSGGAALIDKIFTKKWELESKHYALLAAVVMIKVCVDREMTEDALATLFQEGWLAETWRNLLSKWKLPHWLAKLLCGAEDIRRSLVLDHDPVVEQDVTLPKVERIGHQMTYQLFAAKDNLEAIEIGQKDKCEFCSMFPWLHKDNEADEQTMVCGRDFEEHTYSMTDSEVEAFRNKMLPEDTDEVGLANVKRQARERLPRHGFSVKAKTCFMEGAFGTGKSYQVCKKVAANDAVLVPFKKLIDDYVVDGDGNKIHVKTPHRAIIDAKSCGTLFVDECGSYPYEFLAVAVYLYQPDMVVPVGDFKQSKTLPSEGVCMDRRLNVSGSHYLVKNFRNNAATIEWAVEKYGYHMEKSSKTKDGSLFEILPDGQEEFPEGVKVISPDRAMVDIEESENTVRAFQGQTEDDLGIVVTAAGLRTWAVPCIKLVGLTRARGTTYIRLTDGVSADAFRALVNKVEYVAKSDKMKKTNLTHAVMVGRMVLALRRVVGEARLANFVRAFPSEIMDAQEAEDSEALRQRDFSERPSTFKSLSRDEDEEEFEEDTSDDEEDDESLVVVEEEVSETTVPNREFPGPSIGQEFEDGFDECDYDYCHIIATEEEIQEDFLNVRDYQQEAVHNIEQDNWEFFLDAAFPGLWEERKWCRPFRAGFTPEDVAFTRDEVEASARLLAINLEAAEINRQFWTSAPLHERWAEVDFELQGTRPLDPLAVEFIRNNTREAYKPPEPVPAGCFTIADEWDAQSDTGEDEDVSVFSFLK
jgi:hypothetical protein